MVLSAKFVQPRLENDFPISIKNVKTPSLIFINLLRDRYRIFYTLSDLTLVFIKDFKFKKGNRQSQTKMGKIGDLLKNQDQVKKICKAAFDEVDTDKSGNIDQKELGILMTKISAEAKIDPPTESDVAEAMQALDTNKDGQISLDEFSVLVVEILKALASKE